MIATLGPLGLYGVDESGVEWTIDADEFTGWDDGAASTVAVVRKPRQRGGWAGAAFDAPAHYSIGGLLIAPSPAVMLAARDRLKAAASLDETTLTIVEEGVSKSAKVRREDQVLFKRLTPTVSSWSIQLVAPDPRKYGAALTGSTGLPAVSGGLTLPFTVPFTITSTVTSGRVVLTNAGNVAGPVTMRLTGPSSGVLRGPIITHQPSGRRLAFGPDRVLPAGEFWDLLPSRQVLAGGTEPRTGWLVDRGWPELVPGENTFHLSAIEGGPGASLSVSSWSAWQ